MEKNLVNNAISNIGKELSDMKDDWQYLLASTTDLPHESGYNKLINSMFGYKQVTYFNNDLSIVGNMVINSVIFSSVAW